MLLAPSPPTAATATAATTTLPPTAVIDAAGASACVGPAVGGNIVVDASAESLL